MGVKPEVGAKPASPKAFHTTAQTPKPKVSPKVVPKKHALATTTTTTTTGPELDAVLARLLPLEAQYVQDALEDNAGVSQFLSDLVDGACCAGSTTHHTFHSNTIQQRMHNSHQLESVCGYECVMVACRDVRNSLCVTLCCLPLVLP